MRAEAIFVPVGVLAVWTGMVLLLTGLTRVRAVRAGRLHASAFKLGESKDVPSDVSVFNRNLMNLLEMPVLFYFACIVFYVTGTVDGVALTLAWLYVALRVVHSVVHLTYNNVIHRLRAFGASAAVLFALWGLLLVRTV
jgi:hypothetical protein